MVSTTRGLALENSIRVLGINSTEIVKEITRQHNTSPCASAALGRTISIVTLMGIMKDDDTITVTINGDGPIKNIHAQFYDKNKIRAYVDNPNVPIYINSLNKLGVKEVVGTDGTLNVNINNNLKSDYNGASPLVSGEISEDFTYYFAVSEQTPSVVSSGVLVDKDNCVISSGAIIIQLLPNATEDDIKKVEESIEKISNISDKLLTESIEQIIKNAFDDYIELENREIISKCTCSKDEMYYKIATLSIEDLDEINKEDKQLEAVCPWCNSKYLFDEDDISNLIKKKQGNQI